MTYVSAVGAQVTTVGTQVSFVAADIAAFASRCTVIPPPDVTSQLPAVRAQVTSVAPDILPVLTPVNAVVAQVAPLLPDVFSKSKSRSQYGKTKQGEQSSLHVESLSFWAFLASGEEQTLRVKESCSI